LAPLARQDRRLPWRPGIALFDGDEHRVDDPLARLDCLDCLPDRTFARMSAGDILIQVRVGVERPIRVRKTFAWPPRITRRQIAGLEGVPRRIGVYQGQTRVGTREVGVFAFFGRAHPTSRQLKRANAELRRCHVG
jgi:hypothetical protein